MALYTGKGDAGTSKIFSTPSGERISKGDEVFEVLGNLDEINSFLGICKIKSRGVHLIVDDHEVAVSAIIHALQKDLFIVQAAIAGADLELEERKVAELEELISIIEGKLPPITTFFISGGTELAAFCDTARTVTRRAERSLVRFLALHPERTHPDVIAYLNRLSSVLYALARFANHQAGVAEEAPDYK